jgi:hypothetical protein
VKLIQHSRAAAVLLVGALAACSDAPTGAAPAAELTLAQQVAVLGFRSDMIEDHGEFVLVEGDIYLSKAQLRTVRVADGNDPMSPRFQYRTTNLVGSPKVHTINVDLSGLNSQAAWKAAAQTALTHWSGISNSYVKLVEGTPADITVSTTCTSYNVAAYASFPSAGNPGSTIYVNTCFGYTTSSAQKVHNMVHEFGHTLGFRHSNYAQQGETAGAEGAVHISGTPTSGNASGSVMNGGTALNSWAGFANSDLVAVRSLYPLPYPAASVSYPSGNVVVSWPALTDAYYYQIRYMYRQYSYNGYENRSWEQLSPGSWQTVYGTSYDSGVPWTGQSSCYAQYGYDEYYTDTWYEVRAVFPNGVGPVAYVGAEDLTC